MTIVMLFNKLNLIRGTVLSNCKDIKIKLSVNACIDSINRMMQLFSTISLIV